MLPNDFWKRLPEAREESWYRFGKRIHFYVPGFTYYNNRYYRSSPISFPSISVTGSYCSLNCDHCGGRILKTMIPAGTPSKLIEICTDLKRRGAVGCLISGGCLPDGSVPISKFIDAIREIKKNLGLTIVVHTGLIDFNMASRLKEAGVDAVSIDIIGSNETIREVYHLNMDVNKYAEALEALKKAGIPFTPHILVGLHYGSIKGENEALRMIAEHDPSALIIIIFFPIKGTKMETIKPPAPKSVINILLNARLMMPDIPIALGCARPKGSYRAVIDVLAVEAGVNAIAFPSIEAIERAKNLGLKIIFSNVCCSQIYRDCLPFRH
ncbi:MAG: radical SAM protein [Candidatus Bathyarchaeia archaeon]